MSTGIDDLSRQDEMERRHEPLLCALEADSSLFLSEQLQRRLVALDDLDAKFGGFEFEAPLKCRNSQMNDHAKALRARLEIANVELYRFIRSEIIRGAQPHALLQWIYGSASQNPSGSPPRGLGFDWRDELVNGVLQFREPSGADLQLLPEMVPYQPTPVRHILHLIAACSFSEEDVFVDLGSGLGHVSLLVSMLAGVRSLGIEVQPPYVASAQECAQNLHLSSARFLAADARAADLSSGNVFYLFSPFTGSILADALCTLQMESTRRAIKICSLGPCTRILEGEAWLRPIAQPDAGRITVFNSR